MVDLAGSNDRRKPSLSPRKGNNHSSSASAAFRQSDGDDLLRPESASLLSQQGRRPPTFDGVSVVAVEHDATPSKRIRSNREGEASGESRSNFLHGALHLTTAVIGVGILGLPRALVDLGWPAGIAFMGVATAVSLYTALLLVELCSEGGEERGGSGSSSVGAPCPRSPPPPPEPLPPTLGPPPASSSSSSLSIGVGRRGASVQDLPSLAESSGAPRGEPRRKRGAPTAAATGSSSASPARSSGSSRYETYGSLARATLGPRVGGAVASMQLLACAGLAVTYCVTGGSSLHSITGLLSPAAWSFLFGAAQFPIALAAPDLERLAGVSAGGALASLLYASAAVAASARVLLLPATKGGGGGPLSPPSGSGEGISSPWRALDAASTILFAFGGHFVLPEIAASLSPSTSSSRSSSSSSHSSSSPSPMVPAVKASYAAVALSYFSVAASGAAAFGGGVADDVLLSAGAGPAALVACANAAVCLHVAAGFHVFSQPCYSGFEGCFERRRWFGGGGGGVGAGGAAFSSSSSGDPKAATSLPTTTAEAAAAATAAAPAAAAAVSPPSSLSNAATATTRASSAAARLCYVLLVAAVAAALPFFSVCMTLVGALAFAPATFVLPPAFAFFSRSPSIRRDGRRRAWHGTMALTFGLLSLACSVSAARGLVVALRARLRGLAV